MLLLLILLEITFFLSNAAALSITIQPATIVGQPSLVVWAREPSDGNGQLVFDLRYARPGPPLEDVGLAIANIQAPPSTQFGTAQVPFPSTGSYVLVAVSGPDVTNLGESDQVNAYQVPTSTSTSTPSATASPSASPISTGSAVRHKNKNLGAIIGGTLGGVAFLGLLAALVFFFLRRRQPKANKSWTFHRNMMIRSPVLDIRPLPPTTDVSVPVPAEDIEQGVPHDEDTPTSPVVMIASPSGPRPLIKPIYRPLPTLPGSLNPRQEKIAEQIEQVRVRIMEVEQNAGPTEHIILDDMQKQMSWLQSQLGSAWAIGLTDAKPPGVDS